MVLKSGDGGWMMDGGWWMVVLRLSFVPRTCMLLCFLQTDEYLRNYIAHARMGRGVRVHVIISRNHMRTDALQ